MSEEMKNVHNCDDHNCDCCGQDEEAVVYFEKEDGTEVALPIVDSFEYKDVEYIVVADEEDEASYIFAISEENGEEVLEPLSDDLFDEVSDYYEQLLEEDAELEGEDEEEDDEDEEEDNK